MIESYQNDINDLTKQSAEVDEKYRKLAEKEKKDITEALDYYKELQAELISRRDNLGLDAAVVDKKTQKKKLQEAEEKGVVTDTLFPENNQVVVEETKEPEPESEPEPTEETSVEEKVEPETEVVEEKPEEKTEIEDVWPEEGEKTEETEAEEVEGNGDNEGWPDVVEEWN